MDNNMDTRLLKETNGFELDPSKLLSELEAKYNRLDATEFVQMGKVLRKKIKMLNIQLNPYSNVALDYIVNRNADNSEEESNLGGLSEAVKSRKHQHFSSKLKGCIKLYLDLNDKLAEEIKQIGDLGTCSSEMTATAPTSNDIKLLEKKLSRYECEMSKFEERYPWLRDSKFNLSSISTDINKLLELKKKKSELMDQLTSYDGLSPNITEAKSQLSELRTEFTETNKTFLK